MELLDWCSEYRPCTEGPARCKFLGTHSGVVVVALSLLGYCAAPLPICLTLKKLLRSFETSEIALITRKTQRNIPAGVNLKTLCTIKSV